MFVVGGAKLPAHSRRKGDGRIMGIGRLIIVEKSNSCWLVEEIIIAVLCIIVQSKSGEDARLPVDNSLQARSPAPAQIAVEFKIR